MAEKPKFGGLDRLDILFVIGCALCVWGVYEFDPAAAKILAGAGLAFVAVRGSKHE